jgi:hypothetical protein
METGTDAPDAILVQIGKLVDDACTAFARGDWARLLAALACLRVMLRQAGVAEGGRKWP